MRRDQRTFLAVQAAAPLAAILVLWAWSFVHPINVAFIHRGENCRAWLDRGRAGIDNEPQVRAALAQRQADLQAINALSQGRNLLVAPPSKVPLSWSHSSAGVLPLLMMVLAMVALLTGIVRHALRRRRTAAHRCAACGYSLTGNISGVCPECGTPFQHRTALMRDLA